jgi:peptidoglycan/LPS O-acetylase OafA/YrhL
VHEPGRSGRFHALDGLRGLAALVVVVHHTLLTAPALALPYLDPHQPLTGAARWLVYSPLHLVWAGGEAVLVFFVLSGFVLTLPFLRPGAGPATWTGYFPKRLVRLYLPVLAAVALAAGWALLVPRSSAAGASWWLNAHDVPLTARAAADDAGLILRHGPGYLDGPLWSLRWEVYFSLLLPVYVWAAPRVRPLTGVTGLLATVAVGSATGHPTLVYLPIFGLGAILAVHRDRLHQLTRRWWRAAAVPAAAAALALLLARWWAPAGRAATGATGGLLDAATALGAALVVACFLCLPGVRRGAERPAVQWLGKRSFSLYLVHEPIVVSLALLLGRGSQGALLLPLALPASLLAAHLFYLAVEAPAHRFARWLEWLARLRAPLPALAAAAPAPTLASIAADSPAVVGKERPAA